MAKKETKTGKSSPALAVVISIFGVALIICACMLGVQSLKTKAAAETAEETSEEYVIETEISDETELSEDAEMLLTEETEAETAAETETSEAAAEETGADQ